MESFKVYYEQQEFADWVIREFDQPQPVKLKPKVWSADREEIFQMWKNLRPDSNIQITPIMGVQGTGTYGEDGIRITGSFQFISSVLGHLKDVMAQENQMTKLRISFKGADQTRTHNSRPSYIFRVNAEPRNSPAI